MAFRPHIPLERQKARHSPGADAFRRTPRAGRVKDGRRPPRSGASNPEPRVAAGEHGEDCAASLTLSSMALRFSVGERALALHYPKMVVSEANSAFRPRRRRGAQRPKGAEGRGFFDAFPL